MSRALHFFSPTLQGLVVTTATQVTAEGEGYIWKNERDWLPASSIKFSSRPTMRSDNAGKLFKINARQLLSYSFKLLFLLINTKNDFLWSCIQNFANKKIFTERIYSCQNITVLFWNSLPELVIWWKPNLWRSLWDCPADTRDDYWHGQSASLIFRVHLSSWGQDVWFGLCLGYFLGKGNFYLLKMMEKVGILGVLLLTPVGFSFKHMYSNM